MLPKLRACDSETRNLGFETPQGRIDTTLTMERRTQPVATDGNGFGVFLPF